MKIIPKKRPRRTNDREKRDTKKEHRFKELSGELSQRGYTVRREELKRGLGWRVSSGACRVDQDKLVFVDRRLTQDDQLAFLEDVLAKLL
jgi:hypothetical protein